jgi:uncharacterized SAM-binding protein YcdF (DUF218 family)
MAGVQPSSAMYFIISKIIGFFLAPSNLLLSMAIFGLILWRTRYSKLGKRLTVGSILALLLFGVSPLSTALLLPLENRFPPWEPSRGPPTGMIVLGGVINAELSVQRKEISLSDAAERLVAAAELYRRYPDARLILVGGNSNLFSQAPSESEFAAKLFTNLGIPRERIQIETASRNTAENALNAMQIAMPKIGERWLLITSAYHMPRAVGLFRNVGFRVEAYPVDWQTGGWGDLQTISDSLLGGLPHLDHAIHEWAGLVFDRFSGRTSVLFPAP